MTKSASTDKTGKPEQNRGQGLQQRRQAARLAAVQALYEIAMTDSDPETVILVNLTQEKGAMLEQDISSQMDAEFYGDLVRGVCSRRSQLDESLTLALRTDWPLERLDHVLQAILRSGAYELRMRKDVPPKVIISQYIGLSTAFFAGDEPGLVNGVLDSVARRIRAADLATAKNDPPAA